MGSEKCLGVSSEFSSSLTSSSFFSKMTQKLRAKIFKTAFCSSKANLLELTFFLLPSSISTFSPLSPFHFFPPFPSFTPIPTLISSQKHPFRSDLHLEMEHDASRRTSSLWRWIRYWTYSFRITGSGTWSGEWESQAGEDVVLRMRRTKGKWALGVGSIVRGDRNSVIRVRNGIILKLLLNAWIWKVRVWWQTAKGWASVLRTFSRGSILRISNLPVDSSCLSWNLMKRRSCSGKVLEFCWNWFQV